MKPMIRIGFNGKVIFEHFNLEEVRELAMQITGNKTFLGKGKTP